MQPRRKSSMCNSQSSIYNPQFLIRTAKGNHIENLQFAVFNLESVISTDEVSHEVNPQSAIRNSHRRRQPRSESEIRNLESVICNLQSAI
jgi:hypothetical protein